MSEEAPAQATGTRRKPNPWRVRGFLLLTLLTLWLVTEWACSRVLRLKKWEHRPIPELRPEQQEALKRVLRGEASYLVPDAELGWTIAPNETLALAHSNGQGLRADREYSEAPAPGTLRILAVGGSFTHGDETSFAEGWTQQLEKRLEGVEVINGGVPAYGPDQALLRFRRLRERFAPKVVLFGVMTENLNRVVNVFRPFYYPSDLIMFAKPRFRLAGEGLELTPNPLPTQAHYQRLLDSPADLGWIGRFDYYYRTGGYKVSSAPLPSVRLLQVLTGQPMGELYETGPHGAAYAVEGEAYQILLRILRMACAEASAAGIEPVIVLFPTGNDIAQVQKGGQPLYAPLAEALAADGLRVVDCADSLKAAGALRSAPGGHYLAHSNALVAEQIAARLKAESLAP